MKRGEIIVKVRPALIVAITQDKYQDLILAAISSVIPDEPSKNDLSISPSDQNKLRTKSVIKLDRLFTLKRENVIAELGQLGPEQWNTAKIIFRNLVD